MNVHAQGEAANWVLYGGKIQFWPSNSWTTYASPPPINIGEKLSLSNCDGRLIWHISSLQGLGGHHRIYDSLNIALSNVNIYSSTRILSAKANDTSWLIVNTGSNGNLGLTRTPQLYKLSSVSGINYQQLAHLDNFNIEGFNISKRDSLYGYWMVYYSQTSSRMISMPFDEFGFYPANSVSSDTMTRPFLFTHANRVEFSSSGEILAMADYNSNILHLWRFNKTNGTLSRHLEINLEATMGLGLFQQRLLTLCFSNNSTKIYLKASDFSTSGANGFYQLDIRSWDTTQILNSIQYIAQPGRIYCWPTLAPDGNIYFNSFSDVYGDTLSYGRLENTDSTYQNSNLTDRLYDFNVGSIASSAAGFLNRLPTSPSFLLNPNRYSIVTQNHCLGDSTRLSLYDYQNLDTVVWDFGDGSPRTNNFAPAHLYPTPGLYIVTAFTRYCNRPDTLYYQLEILGNPELPFADTSICRGDSLRLQLPINWQYQWSTGDSTAAVTLGTAGVYHVTLNNGCFTATDSFQLRIVDPATASLPADTGFCAGDSVWVDPGPLAGSVIWSDGGSGARWINQPGNFTLSMTNACGTENQSISIGVYGAPPLALNDTSICEGRVLRIELPEYWETDYQWQDGSTERLRNLSDSGLYIVNAVNPCGYSADSLRLELRDCNCRLYLPNAFSPNGDGINDQFNIISRCALREYELFIYDRWGQNIFRSTTITQGWDGSFKGEMLPVGAYAFVIRYAPEGGNLRVEKGTLQLLR